ncbi:MAG: PEP-CTERM sorting domain-containing protein [Cyanobacteria bacterium]|nr:PEP-CTERM sorting domain-containing protein [Cyanobacteriota bacterium]
MFSQLSKTAMALGTVAGCLMVTAEQASAFTFETNWSGTPPKGDIHLDSVKIGNAIVSDFALVSGVNIISNTAHTGGNTGAASSDLGDDATVGVKLENATNASVKQSLGNRYLSSIIDTEDGNVGFEIELTFDKGFNKLLFWERGINSSLGVTINGTTRILTKNDFALGETDFRLDTTEIGSAQKVGSYGLNLSDFGVDGKYSGPVTIFSQGGFKGPDFKVVGASVPEPATVLGLTAVAGALVASRRRKSTKSA